MKRLLIYGPIFSILILVAAITAFNLGLFHGQIEQFLADKTGSKVQLGSTTLEPKWPLRLEFGDTTFEHELYKMGWKAFSLEVASLIPPYKLHVTLIEPKFTLKGQIEFRKTSEDKSGPGGGGEEETPKLDLSVRIENGDFHAMDVHLRKFNLDFAQKLLLKSQARLSIQSLVQSKYLPLDLPFAFATDNLTLSREAIKGTDVKVSLAGLAATASGASLLKEDRHRWIANVSAADLGQLPKPPMDIPATDWRGAMQAKVELIKEGPAKSWSAEGDIRAEKVSANVKYRAEKLTVSGICSGELATHFRYAGDVAEISNLKGGFDLTQANVVYQDILQKSPSIPLKASIVAHGDTQSFKLESLNLEVWKFNARVNGQTALAKPYAANFAFDIPLFSLEGADRVLLPLAKSPANGQVAASGNWRGELTNALEGHVNLTALKAKDLAMEIDYDKPGVFKAKGPVKGSLEGRFEANKKTLVHAGFKGSLNASEAALVAGPLRKEAKRAMLAAFEVRSSNNMIEISNLALETFFAKLRMTGKVLEPFNPRIQVKVEVPNLNFNELRVAVPEYHDKIPKGSASGQLNISGSYDKTKPWNAWPLVIEGAVRAALPEYTLESAAAQAKVPPPKTASGFKAAQQSDAFLPSGYLVDRLKVKILADVETFKKDKLAAKGVRVEGMVTASHFKGGLSVREIFGGGVEVLGLDLPLVDPRPAILGTAKWREIVIEDALGFAKPEYREFAKGRVAGQTEFLTYLPSDHEFLSFLKAKGEVNAQPVTLNSVKLGEMINNLVKQAPMLKLQPVKMDPLHGQLKASFSLQKQVLTVDPLHARDVDNSELQLRGKVSVSAMQGDFAGTFFWAKPQVQGCLLEGNSDATGRMIIPVAIRGDLMHPGLDSLSDLVTKLGSKALECEGKKLVEKAKKEGTKQLENEMKKQLDKLLGR